MFSKTFYHTAALAVVATLATHVTPAKAQPFQTLSTANNQLTSAVFVDFYLNEPGSVDSHFLTTVGPVFVNGTMQARVVANSSGDGHIDVQSAQLVLADFTSLIDANDLGIGTTEVTFQGVTIDMNIMDVGLLANAWNLDATGGATSFELALNRGAIVFDNSTGVFGELMPSQVVIDLLAAPLSVDLSDVLGHGVNGSADNGPGLNSPLAEINMEIPGGFDVALPGTTLIYASIHNSYGIYVAAPEPGAHLLLGLGLLGLIPAIRGRRAKP